MRSIDAYFDGTSVKPLDSNFSFKKNQKMKITLLDEFVTDEMVSKKIADELGGCFHEYANPELIPLENDAWEKSVGEDYIAENK